MSVNDDRALGVEPSARGPRLQYRRLEISLAFVLSLLLLGVGSAGSTGPATVADDGEIAPIGASAGGSGGLAGDLGASPSTGQGLVAVAGATASPTAQPTPTAGATLAPATPPGAVPTPAPTAPPATSAPVSGGIALPASIDSTGGSDASRAINAWLGSVPNGSTIVFRAGGTYRLDGAIKFSHKSGLVFEGNGATLRGNGGTTEASSIFWIGNYGGAATSITIRHFNMIGNSSRPGVYVGGEEGAHGVLVDGASGINVNHVTISKIWGDCLYVGGGASGVTFSSSSCLSNGRNGVTVTSGSNITVSGDRFDHAGYCTFDLEPNHSTETIRNVRFLNNTAGTWTNSFLSAEGASGSTINGVTVSGNSITGGSMTTIIRLARRQNISITNNRSSVSTRGPVLLLAHIDGLTVTGNSEPLSAGEIASISDCTGVRYQP